MAPLFLTDFDAFRSRHWAHHRNLGLPSDPKYTYRIDVAWSGFLILLLEALTGWGAVRKFRHQLADKSGTAADSARHALIRTAAGQVVLGAVLVVIARLARPESPTVPSYLLPDMTRQLIAQDGAYAPTGSHFGILARLILSRHRSSPTQHAPRGAGIH